MNSTAYRWHCEYSGAHVSRHFLSIFLTPPWFVFDSHWVKLPVSELQKKKWDKSKKRLNKKWWGVCRLFSSVQGLCWARLLVIRVLILLYLALHSCDVRNTIQNDQNEINHESDGSSWLFKPRKNDFGQGFLCCSLIEESKKEGAKTCPGSQKKAESLDFPRATCSSPDTAGRGIGSKGNAWALEHLWIFRAYLGKILLLLGIGVFPSALQGLLRWKFSMAISIWSGLLKDTSC